MRRRHNLISVVIYLVSTFMET